MTATHPPPRGPIARLLAFYRLQLRIIWTWRSGPLGLAWRLVVSLAVSTLSIVAAAWLLDGFRIAEPLAALGAAIVLGILNLFARPVLLALVASVSGYVIALAAIALQVIIVAVLVPLVPGIEIDGLATAFWASWIIAIGNTLLTALLGLDAGETYFGTLVQQLVSSTEGIAPTDRPGVVIVQIDGLPHDVLRHQVRAGQVPLLSSWIRSGSHRLVAWEALLPSQTSASQAGILHGNNDDIPAFRWYEKAEGRLMVSNRPRDAAEITRRVSDGRGLLANGGVSVGNLLTGDATRSYLTLGALPEPGQGIGRSQAFYGFFLSPYTYLHTVVRFVSEVIVEYVQASRQRRAGVEPRLCRGGAYPFLRAATNILLRDLGTMLVIEEMYRGAPVIYVDYTDYDEIAHHSGPERAEALQALDGVDAAIGALERAASHAPRPYRFVVLSDHGQSLGATFLQRYGLTLEALVRSLVGGREAVTAATASVEGWGPVNAFLGELARARGATSAIARAGLRQRRSEEDDVGPPNATVAGERPDLIVVASGNLGLISFPRLAGRQTLEQLDEHHPNFVDALANHPGIGLVLVRTAARGAVAVGARGIRYLDEELAGGVDPTTAYGEHAVAGLRRLDAMSNAPDLALISMLDPATDEVAAFEELIGSHGGLGGPQTRPFIMLPADWPVPDEALLGAPTVHRALIAGMIRLGLRPGADTSHF